MRSVRDFNHRLNPEIWNVWLHLSQFVGWNYLLDGGNDVLSSADEKEVCDQRWQYLQVALGVSIVRMHNGDIWRKCGYQHQWQPSERAGHGLLFRVQSQKIGALHAPHRQKRHAELGCTQLLDEGMAAGVANLRNPTFAGTPEVRCHAEIVFETDVRFFYYTDRTCAAQHVYVHTMRRSDHMQITPSLANKFAQQGHRFAPGQPTTNGNNHAILYDGCRLSQRQDR